MYIEEYQDILYSGVINVYIDHKNIIFHTLSASRVVRWKFFLKKYDITLTSVPAKVNVLTDCFSVLPRMDEPLPRMNERNGKLMDFKTLVVPNDNNDLFMLNPAESKPTLQPTICINKEVYDIELYNQDLMKCNTNSVYAESKTSIFFIYFNLTVLSEMPSNMLMPL